MRKIIDWLIKVFKYELPVTEKIVTKEVIKEIIKEKLIFDGDTVDGDMLVNGNLIVNGEIEVNGEITCYKIGGK